VPPAAEGPANGGVGDTGGRIIGTKSTLPGLALALSIFLRQQVVDDTGVTGFYDFDVRWSAPAGLQDRASSGLGAEGLGLLISAAENHFGLQLVRAVGPVKYWVVEHVERPSQN